MARRGSSASERMEQATSDAQRILDALKAELRARRITYAAVAKHLAVSEATVKRLFTGSTLTLDRLEAICTFVGVRLADLAAGLADRPAAITALDAVQERALLDDRKLLLVTFLVLNGWRVDEIVATFEITEPEVIRRLAHLDRLGMVELLPGNRIRRRVARHFAWRKNGPVERFFEAEVKRDFLASSFAGRGEHLRFLGGLLSRESVLRMQRAIDELAAQLDEHMQRDLDLPLEEKFGVGAVFALRPWELPAFRALRRAALDKRF